jgi:hypothetical protein
MQIFCDMMLSFGEQFPLFEGNYVPSYLMNHSSNNEASYPRKHASSNLLFLKPLVIFPDYIILQ